MPTYEYRCEECGRTLEVVQSIHDDALTTCEHCGGTLRKVYAPVGIVFKGSGFYKTDSRSSTRATRDAAPKEGAKDAPKDGASVGAGSKDGAGTGSGPSDSGAAASTSGAGSSGAGASSVPAKSPSP